MKESERLKMEADKDDSDNDFRCLNWARKIQRAKRKEKFEEKWLPKLMRNEVVVTDWGNKYVICYIENDTQKTVDYYPKANKSLIRHLNKWVHPGLDWIIKQFNL